MEGAAHLGSGDAVDVRGEQVAVEGDYAVDLVGFRVGGQERAAHEEVKVAAGAQVVDLGRVPLYVDGLAGFESLQCILVDVGPVNLKADAVESNLLGCVECQQRLLGSVRSPRKDSQLSAE